MNHFMENPKHGVRRPNGFFRMGTNPTNTLCVPSMDWQCGFIILLVIVKVWDRKGYDRSHLQRKPAVSVRDHTLLRQSNLQGIMALAELPEKSCLFWFFVIFNFLKQDACKYVTFTSLFLLSALQVIFPVE